MMSTTAAISEPDSSPVDPPILGANPFVGLTRRQTARSLGVFFRRVAVEPRIAVAGALDATRQLVDVAFGRADIAPERGDRRFTDAVWATNPIYRRMMQAYLVERRALLRLVDQVDLDHKSRVRAQFALSLLTEAAAPTNTLIGNPRALAKAWHTRGQSLVAGARNLAHDVRHNGGMPSMVDTRPFHVGGNLAATPGQVVHRSDVFELIQYEPSTSEIYERPLVMIPPQINKYYITDIARGRSLVEHSVAAGIPYFTLSWRNPTSAQRDWDLDTYVAACREAVEVACTISRTTTANVLGICAGGVTTACLLGHLAASGRDLVHAATFMVAGLDTHEESLVGLLASPRLVEAARARSRRRGALDGRELGRVFAWLRPNDLVWNYWVSNYLLGQNPPAFDILYWNNDTTRLPAALHSDFLDIFVHNALAEPGTCEVLGTPVDLSSVTCDAYVVAGTTDHIIPWTAAYRTTQLLGGTSEFVLASSGHVQAIVNPPGNGKASYWVAPKRGRKNVSEPRVWRERAVEHRGSWWDHWLAWLGERSGTRRPAPSELGCDRHPPLEPAPGRYVHL
jgi:poly[(R)-3-hydroxyalkanoate] polymerase subunit PhaC